VRTGNSNFIGIECEHTGEASDEWPEVQMLALRQGVAALLKHTLRSADWCCGHREYALPAGRKIDPRWDLQAFRDQVAAILSSGVPMLAPIPAAEPDPPPGAAPGTVPRPTLRRGLAGTPVVALQRMLGLEADGVFGPFTEAAVRAFQRRHNLVPDGIVGPKTWSKAQR
jgi:peptidoglycan hydrolase-like protein with peptidoglycan-binding domain